MAYSTVPTVVSGDSWSAAQHNTYIKDNFAALWPFTTAGDIAYAATSTTLARLPIGTEEQILSSVSGVPDWVDSTAADKYCLLRRTSAQSINNNTQTLISFSDEVFDNNSYWAAGSPTVINLPTTGFYRLTGSVTWKADGTGDRAVYIGPTAILVAYQNAVGGITTTQSFDYVIETESNSVSTYMWVWQNSGGALDVNSARYNVTYLGA